jgi:type IV pilus assembly protein PilY1
MTEEARYGKVLPHLTPRWRTRVARLAGLAALATTLAHAANVNAQSDVNPTLANVLLLVDTSGSMEYKSGTNTFPQCRYDANGLVANAPTLSEKSRWTDVVEVLTGDIVNYDCQSLDRGSVAFKNEYKIVGGTLGLNSPYDFLYSNPYHRPISGGCVIGPGTMGTNPADFPATAFNYHAYNNVTSPCTFNQAPDGILDSFQSLARFGLMTFDTDPSPDQGELGTYSYVVGTSHTGLPTGCTVASAMEVGSRNASAPPWEGRLVAFGDPSPGSLDYQNKNQQIQQVLRATRPFGATPVAGMLSDARDFLRNDNSFDLVNTSQKFGPASDPYAACRKTIVLLLSDGQPNMDLRGHCSGTGCPFQLPEQIASDLLLQSSPRTPVHTYVVGFALNTLTVGTSPIDCSKISASDLDPTSPTALCTANPDNASLQACCSLARIAVAGDDSATPHAYFANDRAGLQSAITSILGGLPISTSRTPPVFGLSSGAGATSSTFAASYRFFAGFAPQISEPWSGQIRRERWTCDPTTKQPVRNNPDPLQGDLFANNVNSQLGRARTFYTVQASDSGSGVFSDRTIRPNITTNPDGLGAITGTFSAGDLSTAFVANTSPASMGLTDTTCTNTVGNVVTPLTAQQCRDKYLKWLVGLPNGTTDTRCPATGPTPGCNLVGDIYHSTPRLVPPPSEPTRDESYQAFQANYLTRPLMLYTSTNDGFLHGFKVASNVQNDTDTVQTLKNNEIWAMVPPQVLPHIGSEYPYTHQLLLDGIPVVKDVVARKGSGGTYPYVFERTTADAAAGASPNVTWRTILVQSFGGTFPGYFALDVTNPDPTMTLNTETGGPKFLWQLTSDSSGNPFFGSGGATPIISTLLFDDDGTGAREIPVAILPGGPGGAGNAGTSGVPGCPRATSTSVLAGFSTYPPRPRVPCYTANLGARSLTIVRLDTGKVVRTFRRSKTELPAAMQARVIEAPLDSPITGEPVAFPSDVGAVADRAFVGDQDGALWKVDLSNSSPDLWTMTLFWDAFPNKSLHSQPAPGWADGQPIATAPVLSVDANNNITLAVATGDQNSLGAAPNMINYLWALRDLPDANHVFSADLLWVQQFLGGERVTGSISLFNSYLYFSSVTPAPTTDVCGSGTTNVWGMHYMIPRDGPGTVAVPPDRTVGGKAAPFLLADFGITGQSVPDFTLLGTTKSSDQTVIFGVTVAQVPTCFDTSDVPTDSYIGGHTQISNLTPGKFQLVMQTGAANTNNVNGGTNVTSDGTLSKDLPPLATPSHIDAWASIVE